MLCDEGDEDDVRTDNNGGWKKQNGALDKASIASLTCYDTSVMFTD